LDLFDWDPEKARKNLAKHGVSFEEAMTVFLDPLAGTMPDPAHFDEEERWYTVGMSDRRRLVVVWHAERGDNVRIIGARLPTPIERRRYEEGE
jgi:uncharacterized DUF497 family protein